MIGIRTHAWGLDELAQTMRMRFFFSLSICTFMIGAGLTPKVVNHDNGGKGMHKSQNKLFLGKETIWIRPPARDWRNWSGPGGWDSCRHCLSPPPWRAASTPKVENHNHVRKGTRKSRTNPFLGKETIWIRPPAAGLEEPARPRRMRFFSALDRRRDRRGGAGARGVGLPLHVEEVGAHAVHNVVEHGEHLDTKQQI